MSEEKKEKEKGENGTFTEVVVGLVLLGVLCFISVERFISGTYGVVIKDWLYTVSIVVVGTAIFMGLKWWKRRSENE